MLARKGAHDQRRLSDTREVPDFNKTPDAEIRPVFLNKSSKSRELDSAKIRGVHLLYVACFCKETNSV